MALLEGNPVDCDLADKGLFALPFIKRSMERKQQVAMVDAESILKGLDSKSIVDIGSQSGRLQFSGRGELPGNPNKR